MLDVDTFLTVLYVAVDEFCTTRLPPERRPGPGAALGRSAAVALATFGRWGTFPTARACYRYAARHLRAAFPGLPARSQLNRLARRHRDATTAFALYLSEQPAAGRGAYEPLDTVGVPTRNAKLLYTFRLLRERPHCLAGFQARLAAHVALHNFCLWLNAELGRPRLAFADLIDW